MGVAIGAFILLRSKDLSAWIWIFATLLISTVAFMVNELVDREDVDKYSWNPVHIGHHQKLNMKIVWIILITLSFFGLYFAFLVGYFWWGIVMYVVSIIYSLNPIRLKRRFVLDIAAQTLVWVIIPFAAPAWRHFPLGQISTFLLVMCLVLWAEIFPYQLADYQADLKTGLRSTHIVLGMRASLTLGIFFAISGLVLFFIFKIYSFAFWSIPVIVINLYLFFRYLSWLKMQTIRGQTESMQEYVKFILPISRLLIPYLLIVWYFV